MSCTKATSKFQCRATGHDVHSFPKRDSDTLSLYGIPVFLTQLTEILREESLGLNAGTVQAPSKSVEPCIATGIGKTAKIHGNELLLRGFTVDQVVHDYGDLCQAVTELAIEGNLLITNSEFQTLNRCLDKAYRRLF